MFQRLRQYKLRSNGLPASVLQRAGLALRRHRSMIAAIQWLMVALYLALMIVPAWQPLPPEGARILDNLTLFVQFVFWGVWWPLVILSIMLLGRAWCGLLCPEGALTEWVSSHGLGRGIPSWIRWSGWPFFTFFAITLYGQMTGIYTEAWAALLILGGSSTVAIATGLIYGRSKRVWCRYLCPVTGVFGLLAKVAPLHFRVDPDAWDSAPRGQRANGKNLVQCAPLIDIRRMKSASDCNMCGRCAGERNAVQLAARSPNAEILSTCSTPRRNSANNTKAGEIWSARLLVFGMMGLALGTFQWQTNPCFFQFKHSVTAWFIAHDIQWPLFAIGHWWLLASHAPLPAFGSWLDGALLIAYLGTETLFVGGWIWLSLKLGARVSGLPWYQISPALIPYAGASLFVGLSLITTHQLAHAGISLPWANHLRSGLIVSAALWSLWLAAQMGEKYSAPVRLMLVASISSALTLPLLLSLIQLNLWPDT